MKKAIKIFFSIISGIIIFLVMMPILLAMLLQVGFIQKWAANTATEVLSDIAGSRFSIGKIELGFFNRAYLEDVLIEDHSADTMIYLQKIDVSINNINFITGKIALGNVTCSDGKVYLRADSAGVMNVQQVFDNFKPKIPPPNPPNFRLSATQVNLLNTRLTLQDARMVRQHPSSINFQDMELNDITFQAQNVNVFNYDIKLAINHLSFWERSGFTLRHLSSPRCGVNETGMRYNDLRLETPLTTLVCDHFNLLYQSWWDYNDFVNKVTIDADILPSRIAFPTIAYFIKEKPLQIPTVISFEGKVVGPVPSLQGQITSLSTVGGTELNGNLSIYGLPDIKKTNFRFTLNHLNTNAHAIDTLVNQITGTPLTNSVKEILTRNGNINIKGDFDGLLTNFNSHFDINTVCGLIDASLKIAPSKQDGAIHLIGEVKSAEYNLGKTLNAPNIQNITFKAGVDAHVSKSTIDLTTNATIEKLTLGNYTYGPIAMDGVIENHIFTGIICSDQDPNLLFHTKGKFDLTNPELPSLDFRLNLEKANLVALGVNHRDSISQLSADLRAFITGATIDNLNGNALIDSIYYVNHLDTVHTSAIEFFIVNSDDDKNLNITSPFADIDLKGRNSYHNIFGYLGKMARTFIPSFNEATQIVTRSTTTLDDKITEPTYQDGYYTLNIRVKEANNVASIFLPGLEIAQGTLLDFYFNPARNNFSFNLESDYIATQDIFVEDLRVDSRNITDSLSIHLTTTQFDLGTINLPNLSLLAGIKNNKINLGVRYAQADNKNSALINLVSNIGRNANGIPEIAVDLLPSNIRLADKNWIMPSSKILIDSSRIAVENFTLRSSKEQIILDGIASKSTLDTLTLQIANLNLSPATTLVDELGYSIDGNSSGYLKCVSLFKEPHIFASLDFNDIIFGGQKLGNSILRSSLNSSRDRIGFLLTTDTGAQPARGYYDLKKQNFSFNLTFPEINLALLEPLLQGVMTNINGTAAAKLTLSGTGLTPTLNGDIDINSFNAKVDFTQVNYSLKGLVKVKNNRFTLDPTKLTDPEGNAGEISAFFDSRYFKNLTFGVSARFTNILALQTKVEDNPFFYGKASGTGTLNIVGNERTTQLNIVAQTAGNSSIVLPFSDISTAERSSFITFVDPNVKTDTMNVRRRHLQARKAKFEKLQNELDIKIDLQVLPNTTALISYSNSLMENIIRGQGRGRLQMHINPSQEIFSIDGPMSIEKGSYRLIFAIADKTFTLNGGQLLWTGSPSNPIVDFTGVYKVRTSLEPLTGETGRGQSKTTVDCGITLTENLMNPNITFSIKAPSATPETQNILRNALNTQEALSMQFMSLFISGTFMPDMGTSGIGTMSESILSATGLEFLSSQIESLVSTKNFKIRPTFRVGSSTTSEEVGVQASLSLLEDKVYIEAEGNYATNSANDNRQQNPLSGGGGITVMLNKAGTLSLKGFTRVIDRFDETQGLQESGAGVYFRQGFQDLPDLKAKYKLYRQQIKDDKAERKTKVANKKAARNNQSPKDNNRKTEIQEQ